MSLTSALLSLPIKAFLKKETTKSKTYLCPEKKYYFIDSEYLNTCKYGPCSFRNMIK